MAGIYTFLLSQCAMPMVSAFTDSRYWSIYQATPQPDPRHETDLTQLRTLLEHAGANVPLFRERFAATGFDPAALRSVSDLEALPALTKSDISANFPDRISSEVSVYRPWRPVATSGTVERLSALQDFRKRDVLRALLLKAINAGAGYRYGLPYLEIPPNICRDVCGAADQQEPRLLPYAFQKLREGKLASPEVLSDLRGMVERQILFRQTVVPSYWSASLIQPPEVLDQCLAEIDAAHPYLVKALPVYLYLLGRHIQRRGLTPPRIRGAIMPMGGSLSPVMKATVESAFGVPVYEDYGCAELGPIAAEIQPRHGLMPFSQYFHVEIVKGNTAVRPGSIGRVLLTDLYNFAMPFIRYDIGDVARPLDDRRFEVLGRIQGCLPKAGGGVLTPDDTTDAILSRQGVLLFQITTRNRTADLQVVAEEGAKVDLAGAASTLERLLGPQWRVSVRTAANLTPEPGGKYRFVKYHGPVAELDL